MSSNVFNWDVNGDVEQEFTLGIVRDSNKDEIKNSTYIVENLIPGIPYTITSNIVNQNNGETVSYNPMGNNEYMWFVSNIDSIVFNKDHALLINISGTLSTPTDPTKIIITTINSIDDADVLETLKTYKIKFDLFVESEGHMECFHTYENNITDDEKYCIPMDPTLANRSVDVFYSLLVNPCDPNQLSEEWYYVNVHEHLCQILMPELPTQGLTFDSESLESLYNC